MNLNIETQDAIRQALLAYMREWSEDNYCAGWLFGLEHMLHRRGGTWEMLGRLVGWPVGPDARDGWETWDEAGARYATPDYQVANYGRVVYP